EDATTVCVGVLHALRGDASDVSPGAEDRTVFGAPRCVSRETDTPKPGHPEPLKNAVSRKIPSDCAIRRSEGMCMWSLGDSNS
ncbi:hypothetical protein ABZV52_22790, partial [Streptomyces sp. NPDC004735]|uniref:hypothetical protein n=1 Tax=Streptomyces sp. NPDC004735 TaxID=3156654 RepID=UPI0033A0D065